MNAKKAKKLRKMARQVIAVRKPSPVQPGYVRVGTTIELDTRSLRGVYKVLKGQMEQ